MTAIDNCAVAFAELLSVTCTVKVAVLAADGVPAIAPAVLSVSPAGSAPAVTAHVYPPVPPADVRVCEYAAPTTPPGSADVVTLSPAVTAIDNCAVAFAELLSVTCTVKVAVAAVDGVPAIAPVALNVSPAGNAPALTPHVYPPVPPVAARDCEYATPTTPPGSDDVLTLSPAVPAIDNCFVAFAELLSVTCTVKVAVPAADGIPAIAPTALSVNPTGSAPALTLHVYPPVPPVAARVCEYAAPTTPPGSDDVLTLSPAVTAIDH